MKITWQYIERTIYLLTVVIGVVFYFRDKATRQAVFETKIEIMLENQKNILEKFKETDIKWEKQAEINGTITTYMLLDSPK
jgi:uncharacterized protein with HEPN domain